MNEIIIIGASGHGKVAADIAELMGFRKISFADDKYPKDSRLENWAINNNVSTCMENIIISNDVFYFVAIGDNAIRMEILTSLKALKANLATLYHPSSSISKYSIIGKGVLIAANSVIGPFTNIADGCIINTATSIDHDCLIDEGVHISPGANLAGNVTVKSNSWVGMGSSIRQNINIGKNAIVASGAAVIKDVEDNCVVGGVPASLLKNIRD